MKKAPLMPVLWAFLVVVASVGCGAPKRPGAQLPTNPLIFSLQQPVPGDHGGIFAHDLDGDGLDGVAGKERHK